MPNYILSRTSPPAHIYERKINLGYGIKVDTSDAPTNQAQKGKEMNDAKEVLDVADKGVNSADGQRGNPTPTETPVGDDGYEINAFASHSALLKAEKAEEAKGKGQG